MKSSGREAHLGRLSQPPSSETLGVATVMLDSKRRPASTQAVSRKVEGIEPRNQVNRKDDGVKMCGSQYGHYRKGTAQREEGKSVAGSRIVFDSGLSMRTPIRHLYLRSEERNGEELMEKNEWIDIPSNVTVRISLPHDDREGGYFGV